MSTVDKTVPRVAESADDLQVGQAVAVGISGHWRAGTVRREADGRFICDRGNENGLALFGWTRRQQTVIILAEPEPPEPEAQDILHRINMQTSLGSVFGSQTEPDTLYMPTALICRLLDGEKA